VLGAFAVFYLQCPSFLEHQRQMQNRHGHNNAQRLFGVLTIPTPNQIKHVVDGVIAAVLLPVFSWVCQALAAQGLLKAHEVLDGLDHQVNVIFVCLPTSHRACHEWLTYLEANNEVYRHQARVWTGSR